MPNKEPRYEPKQYATSSVESVGQAMGTREN
jgi:hypothetical protein